MWINLLLCHYARNIWNTLSPVVVINLMTLHIRAFICEARFYFILLSSILLYLLLSKSFADNRGVEYIRLVGCSSSVKSIELSQDHYVVIDLLLINDIDCFLIYIALEVVIRSSQLLLDLVQVRVVIKCLPHLS